MTVILISVAVTLPVSVGTAWLLIVRRIPVVAPHGRHTTTTADRVVARAAAVRARMSAVGEAVGLLVREEVTSR